LKFTGFDTHNDEEWHKNDKKQQKGFSISHKVMDNTTVETVYPFP
jgi:hypothetical protein